MIPLLSNDEIITTYHHQLCIASDGYHEITVLSYKQAHSSCFVVFVVRYSSSHNSFIRNRESYFTETRQKRYDYYNAKGGIHEIISKYSLYPLITNYVSATNNAKQNHVAALCDILKVIHSQIKSFWLALTCNPSSWCGADRESFIVYDVK